MKDLRTWSVDRFRVTHPARLGWAGGWSGDETCGAFEVPSMRSGHLMYVIASSGEGWDHVSVSLAKRTPNWYEMEQVKRLFFQDDEVAMQLHIPPDKHIDIHPNCLHLWRPHMVEIPLPPDWMVGPRISKEKPDGTAEGSKEPAADARADGAAENPQGEPPGAQGGAPL